MLLPETEGRPSLESSAENQQVPPLHSTQIHAEKSAHAQNDSYVPVRPNVHVSLLITLRSGPAQHTGFLAFLLHFFLFDQLEKQ